MVGNTRSYEMVGGVTTMLANNVGSGKGYEVCGVREKVNEISVIGSTVVDGAIMYGMIGHSLVAGSLFL